MLARMRADATHRFEFQVVGGRLSRFVCLARTRAEAEQIARNASGRVTLLDQVPLGIDEGDIAAKRELHEVDLLSQPWRDDVVELVSVLDHVRFEGGAMSVVPVAFLPAAEATARGLPACGCGKHDHAAPAGGLVPVQSTMGISAVMDNDGGWELHLHWDGPRPELTATLDWQACPDRECHGLALGLAPGCSVWTVAHEVLFALMVAGALRPGELSCVAIDREQLAGA